MKLRSFGIFTAVAALWLVSSTPSSQVAAQGRAAGAAGRQISQSVRHDTSRPLRELATRFINPGPNRQVRNRVPLGLAERAKPFVKRPDPVRQLSAAAASATLLSTFEGLSDDDNAQTVGFRIVPPDTVGDVGSSHYVQFVNSILAVYDKNGTRLFGPVAGNAIWEDFGGICEENNDGDPIALYDHIADRWIVSQFAIGDDGFECVAVSASNDPTGEWHRYAFNVSPGAFNDYPKLGVWPDGYYMSANEFESGFSGAIAVVFERDRMLKGQSARMVKFGPLPCAAECFFSLQPSDLDGPAPARGTPNTFVMSFDDEVWGTGGGPDGYRLWDFAVDWSDPEESSFTALSQVNAPEFDANLCNFGPCVQQPNGGERLDTLAQFTMFRAQYRSDVGGPTIVVSHTVDATGRNVAAPRWAVLRKSGTTWSLNQTGTYALSDGHDRWMSSAAMDRFGNLALGYSVSSKTLFPSIRYATRLSTDPAGTLGAETELQAGAGVQKQSFNRWGDYSSMNVDPADNCTFWYTQEYYANTGNFDFKTRVGSFKLPGC